MSQSKETTVSKNQNITLKGFIEDNEKLLTAIGVMGALAALFANVANGQYVAFLSFVMLLVLYAELYRALWNIHSSKETMSLFKYVAFIFPTAVCIFLSQTYWSYFKNWFMPLIVTEVLYLLVPALRKSFSRKTSFVVYMAIIIIFIITYFSVILPHLPSTFPLSNGNQTGT
jgi:hypothetical protein